MIIKREELYEKLREICPGKYSVGLHGISLTRVNYFYGNQDRSDDELSEEIAKNIVERGLRVEHGRSVNGTVKFFGRLDSRDDLRSVFDGLSYYTYGSDKDYIIVATPIEFKKSDGTTLYVGKTNLESEYKRHFDTTGNQESSILDKIILNYNCNTIDPSFIIGRFKILEDGQIDFQPNEQHISKQNDTFSNEEFDKYTERLFYAMPFECFSLHKAFITKDITQMKSALPILTKHPEQNAFILETITQLLEEENVQNLTDEDLKTLEELKQECRKIQAQNKAYFEEKQRYLESLKSYTLEQIQEFALNNPYRFNDFPPEIKNNVELMRQVAKTPGLRPIILCYMGDAARNDPTTMINLVNNCDGEHFDFIEYPPKGRDKSDLAYTSIGLEVRSTPLFWESLNTRIQELNQTSKYERLYFDTEKELRLAEKEKERTPKQIQ